MLEGRGHNKTQMFILYPYQTSSNYLGVWMEAEKGNKGGNFLRKDLEAVLILSEINCRIIPVF